MKTKEIVICNDELLQKIQLNIAKFNLQVRQGKGFKQAAVALVIVEAGYGPDLYGLPDYKEWNNQAALILTRRSFKLKNHPGQWALPGGSIDNDETPEEAALRELEEEVGLTLNQKSVLGRLDDYTTHSGFTIRPVVVWGGPAMKLRPNPHEVESIHRIPIAELMRKDAPILENIPELENPVLHMPVGNTSIAAPTAAMLYQFREVAILGNSLRVSHYEQPFFAWH